jgi:Ran GTPase-activating protein (RanGAP) involved in mRNA processing and transport
MESKIIIHYLVPYNKILQHRPFAYASLLSTMIPLIHYFDSDGDCGPTDGIDDDFYDQGSDGSIGDDFYDQGSDCPSDESFDFHYTPPPAYVLRICAQLRANDPSIEVHQFPNVFQLREVANKVFTPSVEDSSRRVIAEALLRNTIVRRIVLEMDDYRQASADAMAKFLAQSKHLMYVDLGLHEDDTMHWPHQQHLNKFIKALGQSTSLRELSLRNLGRKPASKSFKNMLTQTKTLQHLRIDLKGKGPLEEVSTNAIANGFSKNTTLREIKLFNWQKTSLIPVLTALQDHPALERLEVLGFVSLAGLDTLLRGKHPQLKEIMIARFKASIGKEMVGFESFMKEMERDTTVLNLSFCSVILSSEKVEQLTTMLRRNTVLEDLCLANTGLGSVGLAEVASALHRNTSIKGLHLTKNGLDDLPETGPILRELLRRNKTITILNLEHNKIGSYDDVVPCLAEGFRANTTLKEICLNSCEFIDDTISTIAMGLGQQKRSLLQLTLSDNQITCIGLRALVNHATAALSTLTHLYLTGNPLLDEGASFLAETLRLQRLPSLTHLWLVKCGISDDGLVALSSALEENDTLEYLDLDSNTFSARGYLALASSLPKIKGLRRIDFPCTTSDLSVMSAMLEGFRENTSLHEVEISGGGQGKDWLQQVTFFSDRNKFRRMLQESDTDDRESLGLWSRALASVAMRPDVLFHVLTSKAGLIHATPSEDCNKRKHDDSE